MFVTDLLLADGELLVGWPLNGVLVSSFGGQKGERRQLLLLLLFILLLPLLLLVFLFLAICTVTTVIKVSIRRELGLRREGAAAATAIRSLIR